MCVRGWHKEAHNEAEGPPTCEYGPMQTGAQCDMPWTCSTSRSSVRPLLIAAPEPRTAQQSTSTCTPGGSAAATHERDGGLTVPKISQ